jgi:hypothetical protein
MKRAAMTDQIGSFAWVSYIGSTHDRAYLEYGHPAFIGSGNRIAVYWTPLAELPGETAALIKAGRRPWTNWLDQTQSGR